MRKKISRTVKLVTPNWMKKGLFIAKKKFISRKKSKGASSQPAIVSKKQLVHDFRSMGVRSGDTLLVQTALSCIGFVEGGPNTFIEALIESVGKNGTILIPTFNRPPKSYSDSNFSFDVRKTKTNVGAVAEVFRKRSDVTRSLHPTHSFAAWGNQAKDFLRGHDESDTGFGENTPYDRLVKSGGKILLIGNNNNSLVHYIELQVGFPLTHKEGRMSVNVTDDNGNLKRVPLKLHTMGERLVIVKDSSPQNRDYVLCQDFLVIPYPGRKSEIQALGFLKSHSPFLEARQKQLQRKGILHFGKVGNADSCLMDTRPFYRVLYSEFKENMVSHEKEYAKMAACSSNWNEIQWYYLVFGNEAALKLLKAWRRLLKIR
ncbi:AAC(3) family N-acetyltransferase [Candidatus Micrarchaeota archaeon]|nr:AAC(3) family N-acetyltransferase [Candidatus Micrarchaeota archaeon]